MKSDFGSFHLYLARVCLSLVCALSVRADSLDTWTIQTNGLPKNNSELFSVAFGVGNFVAVGWSMIVSSTNGTNWTYQKTLSPGTNNFGGVTNTELKSITYGNGIFAAAGYEALLNELGTVVVETSSDGVNWTLHELPFSGASLPLIAYGNGRFVVVASSYSASSAFVSTDGATWNAYSFNSGAGKYGGVAFVKSLVFGNNQFACVTDYGQNVLSSPDGSAWTAHALPTSSTMKCIGYGEDYGVPNFVVCGDFGDSAIFSSADLNNWSPSIPSSDYWVHNAMTPYSIAYGNETYVVGGFESIISNALRWTRRYTDNYRDIRPQGIVYGNGLWVAVGGEGTSDTGPKVPPIVMTSGTLIQPFHVFPGLDRRLAAIAQQIHAVHAPKYIAVGDLGSILGSTNGMDWEVMSSQTSSKLNGVTATENGGYIAVGNSGTILSSDDGLDWVPETSPTLSSLLGITEGTVSGDTIEVAVGAGGTVLTSSDGSEWTPVISGVTNDLRSLAYGNGPFIALSADGKLLVSTDAAHWQVRSPQLPTQSAALTSLSFGNNQFSALDSTGNVLVSTDGIRWNVLISALGSGTSARLNGLSLVNGELVAVGDNGTIVGLQLAVSGTGTEEDLSGITYGNNLYVAVGEGGTILKSTDGVSWNAPTSPPDAPNWLSAVAFGNGRFVAVGESTTLLTSTDGDHWTEINNLPTDADFTAVTFGAGRFLVIGNSGVIITSTDGLHWQVADSGTTHDLLAVTWANDRFVITSEHIETSLASNDGIHWSVGGNGLADDTVGIAGGGGIFIAVDKNGNIYLSTDGLAWVQKAATGRTLTSVAYNSGLFVAAGTHGTIFASSNGTHWNQLQSLTDLALDAVIGTDSQFVAVGDYGTSFSAGTAQLQSLPAGLDWTTLSTPAGGSIKAIAFNGHAYVTIGVNADSAVISTDVLNWTVAGNGLNSDCYGLAWGNNVFVALGYGGIIFTSSNGTDWTRQADLSVALNGIAFGNGAFVIAAHGGEAFRSTDGIHWTPQTTGLVGDLEGITYGGNQFVVVAYDGTIAVSSTGNTWTMAKSPVSDPLYAVAYGNGQYAAVGESGTVVTSADGLKWVLQTDSVVAPSDLHSITWGNGQFVAVGDNGWTIRSVDGINWISSNSSTVNSLASILFAEGRFIAVGQYGTIIETTPPTAPKLVVTPSLTGSVDVVVQGTSGSSYNVEVSDDLIHWAPLASVGVTDQGGTFSDTTTGGYQIPHRFYRAALLP